MFENIMRFFRKLIKSDEEVKTKDTAKERLHLVLMQDRANVSAEFLALMKQEIIEVIKKYIEVDEGQIDVKLTNQEKDDGTTGAPVLYANIPIIAMKEVPKQQEPEKVKEETESEEKVEGEAQPVEADVEKPAQQDGDQESKMADDVVELEQKEEESNEE